MRDIVVAIDRMQHQLKQTDISGCITGSSLTGQNFDDWAITPDIDVFCYSPYAMVHAIDVCEYQLDLAPGGDEETTDQAERWKVRKMRTDGIGKGRDLATCKFTDGEVTVNVSYRRYQRSAMDVIARFDMTIDMVAVDIPSGTVLDMRECDMKKDVAEVIEASRYVSEFKGGEGAVRDIIEQVLRAHGDWARDSMGVTPSSLVASR